MYTEYASLSIHWSAWDQNIGRRIPSAIHPSSPETMKTRRPCHGSCQKAPGADLLARGHMRRPREKMRSITAFVDKVKLSFCSEGRFSPPILLREQIFISESPSKRSRRRPGSLPGAAPHPLWHPAQAAPGRSRSGAVPAMVFSPPRGHLLSSPSPPASPPVVLLPINSKQCIACKVLF